MENLPLKLNDTNEDVRKVNSMLQSLHYPVKEVTNIFNESTKRFITSFQNDYRLKVTGMVDIDTWNKLDEMTKDKKEVVQENKQQEEEVNSKMDEVTRTIVELKDRPTLILDDEGEHVKLLQTKLYSNYRGEINGIFDNLTEEAVKTFQANNGLSPDGIVGPRNMECIRFNKLSFC